MSHAARQREFRKRQKQKAMVDIRSEIPEGLRENLRQVAKERKSTIKAEIQEAIEKHVSDHFA